MPAYNAERTIVGAINSILTQTYQNWELIIINDGSTDDTQLLIQKFKPESRIRAYSNLHQGIVTARNFGNQQARGQICAVQDSDDLSLPDRLEKVAYLFNQTEAEVVVHGIYVNAWNQQYKCIERHYIPPSLDALNNKINGVPAYRREVWQKRPFRLETQYYYDYMMHLDWMLSGFKYAVVNEGLYEYIRYQGSASDRFEKSGQRAESLAKVKEILENEYKVKT